MPNQYTNKKADIPRLDREDIIDVLYDMKLNQKISDQSLTKWLMVDSGYNYAGSYAWELIKDTNELIRKLRNKLNTHTLEDVLTEMENDKQAAKERGDNRLVIDYQKEINKVAGHYKERIEISQDVTFKVKWGS